MIGITSKDVSTTMGKHADWGVFGLGELGGDACVVSTFRIGDGKRRLEKVAVHEVGHTLGLPHCPTKRCVMNDALGKVKTVDQSDGHLCRNCRGNLRTK